MRREEKRITREADIAAVIRKCLVCRLGLSDGVQPYIVPLCFGYKDRTLYFHGAREGRKLSIIRRNPRVCFEFDVNAEIVEANDACKWGMRYQSVIGVGSASIIAALDEKRRALEIIMGQYTNRCYPMSDAAIAATMVFKVYIEDMTGKHSGD